MTPARLIASGLGAGFFPRAPGTAASLAAVGIGAGLMALWPPALLLAALVAALGGWWAVRATGAAAADPGWVVIDEVTGQWIAMLGLARVGLPGLLAAFLLFRLLDIAKPGPVGWADRRHDAAGVMADDVIAGAIAALLLLAARRLWPGLGL